MSAKGKKFNGCFWAKQTAYTMKNGRFFLKDLLFIVWEGIRDCALPFR